MKRLVLSGVFLWPFVLGFFTGIAESAISKPEKNQPPLPSCSAWQDSFNTGHLDATRWVAVSDSAPGSVPNLNSGKFLPGNVSLAQGMLALTLTQQLGQVGTNHTGVISNGGMISTKFKCGYGTYEWQMRASSSANCPTCAGFPTSGSVSAGFIYVNNSQTEIDFEFTGSDPTTVWLVNWFNHLPQNSVTSAEETSTRYMVSNAAEKFHDYKLVWSKGKISYYIDGIHIVDHTTNVPSVPGYFMINHWGSEGANWGGAATLGTPRYLYVSHVSYTPPE